MKEENNKFTWGDTIIISKSAPHEFHPGEAASICGFYKIESPETAERFTCNVGDWIYMVELEDGSDIQVAEHYLAKNSEIFHGQELSKYNKHFINGVILDIKIEVSSLEFKIKTLTVQQAISDSFLLSSENCFDGKIIAVQIENLIIKNSSHSMVWKQNGNVLAFEISDHMLSLIVEWDRCKTTLFDIKSGQIWWEKQKN